MVIYERRCKQCLSPLLGDEVVCSNCGRKIAAPAGMPGAILVLYVLCVAAAALLVALWKLL